MQATFSIRRTLVTMASVLALVMGTAAGARAQDASGTREGIKVHGHWIIEVKNPDGTRAQYREFENALVAQGGNAIANLIGGKLVPSTWFIWLGNDSFSLNPCQRVAGVIISCGITTPLGATGGSPNEFFPNLTTTVPSAGPNAGKLVLSGSATATSPNASAIGYVLTQIWMCPTTLLPGAACFGNVTQANMTQTAVTPAIPLVSGQIIQVTVIISFS